MDLTTQILATEAAWGKITRILVPPAYVTGLAVALLDAGRSDLGALVRAGEEGRMVVTAGGRDWPYGGL